MSIDRRLAKAALRHVIRMCAATLRRELSILQMAFDGYDGRRSWGNLSSTHRSSGWGGGCSLCRPEASRSAFGLAGHHVAIPLDTTEYWQQDNQTCIDSEPGLGT